MVTMGDILVTCTQLLVGMYIFELIYRIKISPISSLHHVGAILVAQSAIAISLNLGRKPDATVNFILVTVWGESFGFAHFSSVVFSLYVFVDGVCCIHALRNVERVNGHERR